MSTSQVRSYIFVHSSKLTREQVKKHLNDMPAVTTWRYDLPNCFYVVSSDGAATLYKQFKERIDGEEVRFLFSEYSDNSQGWLTNESWHVLNNKELKRDESKK